MNTARSGEEFREFPHQHLAKVKTEQSGCSKNPAAPLDSSRKPPPWTWWQEGWVFILFLLIATMLAYQPVWHAGFFTDDASYFGQNALVQQPDGWWRIWVSR